MNPKITPKENLSRDVDEGGTIVRRGTVGPCQ